MLGMHEKWFEKVYANQDTSDWLVPTADEAAELAKKTTCSQFRRMLDAACAYTDEGPILEMPMKGYPERQAVAMAAWLLSLHDRVDDARDLLAEGLIDSEGLREAYLLSFRMEKEMA